MDVHTFRMEQNSADCFVIFNHTTSLLLPALTGLCNNLCSVVCRCLFGYMLIKCKSFWIYWSTTFSPSTLSSMLLGTTMASCVFDLVFLVGMQFVLQEFDLQFSCWQDEPEVFVEMPQGGDRPRLWIFRAEGDDTPNTVRRTVVLHFQYSFRFQEKTGYGGFTSSDLCKTNKYSHHEKQRYWATCSLQIIANQGFFITLYHLYVLPFVELCPSKSTEVAPNLLCVSWYSN